MVGEPTVYDYDESVELLDLNGLTHLEAGLWRYCYDNSRRVVIAIGDTSFIIETNPDVSVVLDELPRIVSCLSSGQDTALSFYELGKTLYFTPRNGRVTCVLQCDGEVPNYREFTLLPTQVLDQIDSLLHSIVQGAVDGGYITVAEAQVFLDSENYPC